MSGWRVGYVISNETIIYNILKLSQHLITCPATVLCLYLEKYFDEIRNATIPQVEAVVRKRNETTEYMRSIGLEPLRGSATFYTFVDITGYGHTSLEYALYLLLKYHIAVVPGSAYGASTDNFIRVGVGTEEDDRLKDALHTIKRVLDAGEYDGDFVRNKLDQLNIKEFIQA